MKGAVGALSAGAAAPAGARSELAWWLEPAEIVAAPISRVGSKARTLARHRLAGLPVLDLVVVPPEQEIGSAAALARRFAGRCCVLRSSAPDEDLAGASQAGRYLSLTLELGDAAALERALARVRESGPPGSPPIPVLIQPRLAPDVTAGVAFSRHPLRRGEACLEAARASVDGVTSGTTEPEYWFWDRQGARLTGRGRRVGRGAPVLTAAAARTLLSLALRLEGGSGEGRDIEWAWDGARAILLQDRPLATGAGVSDYFLPERFPQGVSRLGWSLLGPSIARCAVSDPLRFVGLRLEAPAMQVRRRIPHLSREATRALFYYFPQRFIPDEVLQEHAELRISWWRRLWLRPPAPAAIARTLLREPDWFPPLHRKRWRDFLRELNTALETPPLASAVIADASPEMLRRGFDACRLWTERLLEIHRWSIVHAELIWRITGKRELRRPRHATARARRDLEALRRLAADGCDLPESPRWRAFLRAHGHRADSIDPARATWAEDPAALLALLRRDAALAPGRDAGAGAGRVDAAGAGPAGPPQGRSYLPLRGPVARWWRFALELRENQRHHWHRILARLRALCLRSGEILTNRGELARAEQVFQLTLDELLDALAGGAVPPLEGRLALNPTPAAHSLGGIEPRRPTHRAPLMRGLGVSSGCVSGPVCHIRSGADLAALSPGAILVTRAADPAWSPVFAHAGALVQELGGALSHAAILARESGIPAVVGVADATTILVAGEAVQVDGTRGTVTRLRR